MGIFVSGAGQGAFDSLLNIPVTIDVEHYKLHEGDLFHVHRAVSSTGFSFCFKVPAGTKRIHIVPNWSVGGSGELQLWEGRGWDSSSGSQHPIYNRDRNSVNSSILQEDTAGAFTASDNIILDPTNIGGGGNPAGVEIQHWETFGNKNQTEARRGASEYILKNDEIYVITFLSNAGAIGVDVSLDWYEHTDAI